MRRFDFSRTNRQKETAWLVSFARQLERQHPLDLSIAFSHRVRLIEHRRLTGCRWQPGQRKLRSCRTAAKSRQAIWLESPATASPRSSFARRRLRAAERAAPAHPSSIELVASPSAEIARRPRRQTSAPFRRLLRMSPSESSVSLIGLPLTSVPLVLPKSRTSHMSFRSEISACSRETSTDSTRKSADSARPMRNGKRSIVTRRTSPLPSE